LNDMASTGHTFAHLLHPIQPTLQFFLTTAPLSRLLQATVTQDDLGTSLMIFFGQTATHLPQAVHFCSRIRARPFSITMASKGHTFLQVPIPTQPYEHASGPPYISAAAAQSLIPEYSYLLTLLLQSPRQITLAVSGAFSTASTPMISAIWAAAAAPPTGHPSDGAFPATTASAKASHPLKPQAAQFAPGSAFRTGSILSSTSTANFFEANDKPTPNTAPSPPNIKTGMNMFSSIRTTTFTYRA
jgi:hypothetical protein